MSKFIALTKALLKNGQGSLFSGKKHKTLKTVGFILLLVIGFAPSAALIISGIVKSYDALALIGQQGIILSLGIALTCIVILIFGLFYVISTFFMSKDVDFLLPLPLRSSQILGAKFTIVLMYEYLTELIIILPFLITYGVKSAAGPLYYIYGVILFLLLPIIPLVVDSIISVILMRFTNVGAHKERFKTIAGIVTMLLILGLNMFIQSMGQNLGNVDKMVEMIMKGNNSLVAVTSKMFPGSSFATEALLYSNSTRGLLNLLVFLVIAVALTIILMVLAEAFYFKGVVGVSEAPSKRRVLSKEEMDKNVVQSSGLKAYVMKEFRSLFRTSIFFMNCVLMDLIWPIFFVPVFVQRDALKAFQAVGAFTRGGNLNPIILYFVTGITLFIAVSNATTPTAISREGKNLFVCKYLPLSYKKQIIGKVIPGIILNAVGASLLIIPASILFKPSPIAVLCAVIISALIVVYVSFQGIIIDLYMPKLNWDNEQKAVKQNMNVLLHMLLGSIAGVAVIVPLVYISVSFSTAFMVISAELLVLCIITYAIAVKKGVALFDRIE